MKFWNSSVLIPLLTNEPASDTCRSWLALDPVVLVWSFSAVEVTSALERRRREGRLRAAQLAAARRRFGKLESAWSEIAAYEAVRAKARRLLALHALRAADAMQLGAALIACEDRPAALDFVTLDARLASAAEREGFPVLTT